MKIIIVSGIFYPEQTPRTYRTSELAIQLAKYGHDVKLLVPGGDFDAEAYSVKYNVKVETFKPVNYNSNFTKSKFINRNLTRFLDYFFAYPHVTIVQHLYPILANQKDNFDLLISIAAPHAVHWTIGLLLRNKKKIADKWVADCGDPFMLNAVVNHSPPFYFNYLEKLWCNLCDYITVPTDKSYLGYYPKFRDKIKVIPQAFNFDEVQLAEYKVNPVPTFAFSGSFIIHRRDPRPVLDYLLNKGYNFKAIFYTMQGDLLQKYENNKDKIEVRSYIPRLNLLEELSKMDFLLNLENGTSVQTPSKLIDYSLTKRPILSIDCQDINESLLDQFMKGIYDGQRVVEDIDRYNIKNVALQFTTL